jgi:CHAT domain-containing protein/tetratricopeptide (TPR) repeat protein
LPEDIVMSFRVLLCGTIVVALAGPLQTTRAGDEDKVLHVAAGLKINGELGKVSAITYKVKLAADKTYVIYMTSPNPKALDPFLRLLDADNKQLAEDDDSGGDQNAQIMFHVRTAGTYQIVATCFGKGRGPFTVTVLEGADELAVQSKLWGPGHWKVVSFRLALADAEHFAKMDAKQRALVVRANQLNSNVVSLIEAGKAGAALKMAQEAMAIRKKVLGEKHPDYADSLNYLALLYDSQGNYARAEPLFQMALDIRKEVLGEKHPDFAASLNNLASLYENQWNYAKAEPLFQKAMEINKEVLGEKHPRYALSLNNLASLHQKQGKYLKAAPLYQKALDIRKEVLGEKHPDFALSLHNLAGLYHTQRNYAKAEPLYQKAMEINKEVLGEKHPRYALSLNALAVLYDAQGNYTKAEPLYQKALDIRKEVLGEKHPRYALSLNNLADLYRRQGNYAKAEALYQKALDIQKEVLREKHPAVALGLNNLASVYFEQGNYAKAELLYQKALDIRKEVLGEKHPDFVLTLNSLAVLYKGLGDYPKAELLYQKALDIRKEVLGEKHPDFALCLGDLAALYKAQGNHAKAEPLFQKALGICKEVLGEKHPDFAWSLSNLATLYNDQGIYAKAEPLYLKALEIFKEVLGEKHPDFAVNLNNLAVLYAAQGNYTKAEPLCQKSLDMRKEVLGEKHPAVAAALNNLGRLYRNQGNYARAEPLIQKALDIQKEVLGEKHPDFAVSLNSLAYLYEMQRNYAKAEPLYRSALVASQIGKDAVPIQKLQPDDLRLDSRMIFFVHDYARCIQKATAENAAPDRVRACDRAFLLGLNVLDRLRQGYREQQESKINLTANNFDLFPGRIKTLRQLWALETKPEDLEAAFWTAELGAARAFLDSVGNSRANLLAGVGPKLQAEEEKSLHNVRLLDLRIEKESNRPLEFRDADLVGQLLIQRRDAEKDLKQLIARMEKDYPQYAGLKYPQPCKLDQARGCLAPDEVALLFVPGTQASYIVLVEARSKAADQANGLAIFELPGAATLAEHVAPLHDRETLELPLRVKAVGREAFDTLLGPCKERIKDKSLVIVPNGSLCFLPFELLVEEDGKYLVEKHRIRYAPSLTALHFINLWKQKRAKLEAPLFAVGDPIYEADDQVAAADGNEALRDILSREGKPGAFKPLVHSGNEVAQIAKLLGAGADYVLTREKASKASVQKASADQIMAKARYVHFATHGILGVDNGKQPALVLNLVGNKTEDGFLELSEIANLKLNADLVVLSACRTGQGRMARGEGVTGLARAFLYAGSKGVVCSLWSVDDQETSNLMVAFYQQLQKGQSAPEALRAAQLAMIRAGKAPLYWAPFIVIGE